MKIVLVILISLFLVSGCTTKIAYNFLGIYLRWQVSSYVTLTKDQKQYTKKVIKEFHQWHRSEQLPLYASYIDNLINIVNKSPASAEVLHKESDKVQEFLDASAEQLIPHMVKILSELNDQQVEELLSNLKKEREKYKKNYVDKKRSKVIKKHRDDVKDYVKPFFGRFTKEQKELIKKWGNDIAVYEHLSLRQQEISANDLEEALAIRNDVQNLERVVRSLMFYRADEWIPEYEAATDTNQKLTFQLFTELLDSRTEKQKAKTIYKLNNYKSDFLDLSKAQP